MLHRIVDKIEWGLEKSAALMCLLLLVCLFAEVLTRYVFFTSIPEIQYLVPFCFLWMVMFASAIAVRKGTHFEVDLLQTCLPGLAKRIHRGLMLLTVMGGGLIIAWSSIDFVQLGLLKKNPATGIRMIYIYASLLIGGGLIALMALEQLITSSNKTLDDTDAILEGKTTEISGEHLK